MNFAKTIFAVLASVLLVGTQTVFAVGQKESPTKSQVCVCCGCQQMNCCVARPASAPQPVPAAPARTVSQNNLQLIAAVVSVSLQTAKTPARKISFPPSASFTATSVPLFQRDCSYLI